MNNQTNVKAIENGRAQSAFSCAKKAAEDKLPKFDSYVKKIPMMIKTNGLGATFAFMLSKKGKTEWHVYKQIGEGIADWLKVNKKFELLGLSEPRDFIDLSKKSVSIDSSPYRALTVEVLSYLNWLRRFADGLYGEEK